MTKNQPISEENKAAIREEVKQARRDGWPTLASIARKYNIHPTMISKIAPTGYGVKAKPAPKRRTAEKVKANGTKPVYTEQDWEQAFDEWISLRNAEAAAREKVIKIAKTL
jgi:hypothetical protein